MKRWALPMRLDAAVRTRTPEAVTEQTRRSRNDACDAVHYKATHMPVVTSLPSSSKLKITSSLDAYGNLSLCDFALVLPSVVESRRRAPPDHFLLTAHVPRV